MTLTGNVADIAQNATRAYVQFTPLSQPTLVGSAVVGASYLSVQSDEDGEFSVDLSVGAYRVTVDGVNILILIETEDGEGTIDDVVTSEVNINVNFSSSGWVTAIDVADLRLKPWKSSYKWARLSAPLPREPREWIWAPASTETDDGLTVVKPFDITAAEEGRWHVW